MAGVHRGEGRLAAAFGSPLVLAGIGVAIGDPAGALVVVPLG